MDLANQSSVPDVMRAFNARATSGVYEREDAAAAAARTSAGSGSSRFLAGLVSGGVAKELEELLRSGDFGRITTSLSARLRRWRPRWTRVHRGARDARTKREGRMKEDGKKTERGGERTGRGRIDCTLNERFELQEIYIS